MDNQLKRFLKLTELNKSDEQLEFEKKHTLHIGIIDDLGIDSIVKIDNIYDIDKILSISKSFELRTRMNGQRNATALGFWIPNILVPIKKESYNDPIVIKLLRKISFKI